MNSRSPRTVLAALCLALAAGSAVAADGDPFPPESRHCVVVAGSAGILDEEHAQKLALAVVQQVSQYVHDYLSQAGYAVELHLPARPEDSQAAGIAILRELKRTGCRQALQVSHTFGSDADGPNFQFDVTLVRFTLNGAHSVTAAWDWHKNYRIPRNEKTFREWHTGTFADEVVQDMLKDHALDGARAGVTTAPASAAQ